MQMPLKCIRVDLTWSSSLLTYLLTYWLCNFLFVLSFSKTEEILLPFIRDNSMVFLLLCFIVFLVLVFCSKSWIWIHPFRPVRSTRFEEEEDANSVVILGAAGNHFQTHLSHTLFSIFAHAESFIISLNKKQKGIFII